MKRMVVVDREKRASPEELLDDPWLTEEAVDVEPGKNEGDVKVRITKAWTDAQRQ